MRLKILAALLVLPALAMGPALAADGDSSAVPVPGTGTVLITGANRGIGYEFARQYAERGWTVIATARRPKDATELNKLAAGNPGVRVEKLDVTSDRSVRALAARLAGVPIDVLINNAGILGNIDAQKYGSYDFDAYDEIIDVNWKGPMRMTEAFMDNVAASRDKKIMNISSAVGSIEMTFPGQVFYRSSKAALNMATRTLSKEVKRDPDPNRKALIFGLINPGVVDTGFAKNVPIKMITAEESASYCIKIIDSFTPDKSGMFFDYKGAKLPW